MTDRHAQRAAELAREEKMPRSPRVRKNLLRSLNPERCNMFSGREGSFPILAVSLEAALCDRSSRNSDSNGELRTRIQDLWRALGAGLTPGRARWRSRYIAASARPESPSRSLC